MKKLLKKYKAWAPYIRTDLLMYIIMIVIILVGVVVVVLTE